MTAALSTALARPGFSPVHDRGRVLVDTAVCIADGGRVPSDLATLRDQGELSGPVASDPTLWPGSVGTSWVTGRPTCGSSPRRERPSAGAQLCALEQAHGWRYPLCATHTPRRQWAFLEARHRAHARVQDVIRCGKSTGPAHLPSTTLQINAAWCVAAAIAADLLCRLRLGCLDRSLADAEPKTLRYRILHTAIRLVRGQRKRTIKIPETWPGARELEAAFLAAFALTAPT